MPARNGFAQACICINRALQYRVVGREDHQLTLQTSFRPFEKGLNLRSNVTLRVEDEMHWKPSVLLVLPVLAPDLHHFVLINVVSPLGSSRKGAPKPNTTKQEWFQEPRAAAA